MSEQIPSLTKGTDSEKKTLLITQDRQQDNIDRYFQAAPSEIPPPIASGTPVFTAVALPNGFVRYHTTNTCTGSAQTLNMNVTRPHRIIRAEYAQYVTSSGAADATGLNVNFARYNLIGANDGTGFVSLANTNGNQAVSNVVFSFAGAGYEDIGSIQSVGQIYQHRWTGQNNDTITIEVVVQYL